MDIESCVVILLSCECVCQWCINLHYLISQCYKDKDKDKDKDKAV